VPWLAVSHERRVPLMHLLGVQLLRPSSALSRVVRGDCAEQLEDVQTLR